ncbi:hypothetical protein [Williamsia phyllosphaerae]|uniref:Mce-associated membrane protein n=1 Tax=Williamsia phyllosphaerae TaxID=885042 RepID=A0ABQ1UQR4_9NOCA|nr:hypothetical protein [Williamsia phyllosphaerae]GGF24466.1 hypothetical protein GCM10007298_20450 [Williamsia phyllosphaerae]
MSAGETGSTTSVRLAAARTRLAEATEVHAAARAAADDARRDRARRVGRWARVVSVVGLILTVALVVAAIVLVSVGGGGVAASERADAVLASARAGIATALTADPGRPSEYVESVLGVSTGEFRRRVTDSRGEIESSVAAQAIAGTGQVISAGIVGPDPGSAADVLLVAEATNPQLLGGGAGDARIVLLVHMVRADGAWKIERAQLQ